VQFRGTHRLFIASLFIPERAMGSHRLSFTERRQRRLAKKVDRIDRLESTTTITELISITSRRRILCGKLRVIAIC
jgi:hypothetical protein